MVVCAMDISHNTPSVGRACSKSSQRSTGSKGFRLMDEQAETGSIYSIYKQKIDSMFESDSSGQASNMVQAKIERMFTEVARDEGIKVEPTAHHFSIDYLGSIPLQQKVTSLAGLQTPLKELYFAYKRNLKHKATLTGKLEISQAGLKVHYQGDKGDLEQLNPFPTIAVWSAVKFVLRDHPKKCYAFLPLITDPDNLDKQSLFKDLEEHESKYIMNQNHAPLFAVVMRKIGLHKQLECHGFVCQTSEDAIVIAATLYKSLMSHMKSKDRKPKNRNGLTCMSVASSVCADSIPNSVPVRPPRKKRSTASSVASETETGKDIELDKQVKKSVKSKRAPSVPTQKNQENMDEILPYENSKSKSLQDVSKQNWGDVKSSNSEDGDLNRTRSVRRRSEDGMMLKSSDNSGDILTKVTIPRSGSFLNAGGLTRYKSKVVRSNGQASGGSPLGFNELFNEFRLQEGLHSMDDILGVIIDSEGMSFNDLKPIYKEFLLKLAVTLTKDELYQRSKSIMRRQKKKLLRKNSAAQKGRRNIIIGAKGLKRVFRKSFRVNLKKKFYGRRPKLHVADLKKSSLQMKQVQESSISTSSYDTRHFRPKQAQVVRKQSYRKRNSDIKETNMRIRRDRMSTSEDSDFFTMRKSRPKTSPSNQNRNSSSGYVSCSECSYDSDTCTCVSADKCYCSLGNKIDKKLRTHSAYCQPNDRCYCTPGNQTFSWCGCDTDSCTDSNKCYCQNFNPKSTIFEQLKRQGFIPRSGEVVTPPNQRKLCKKNSNTKSTKSVEYVANPLDKYYEKIERNIEKNFERNLGRRSVQNFESKIGHAYGYRPSQISDYKAAQTYDYNTGVHSGKIGSKKSFSSENLPAEYEVFGEMNNETVYKRAMSDVASRNFQRNSVRSFKSFDGSNIKTMGKTLQATVPASASTEALSVKKSAEIAALFADIKLSQTTDITHLGTADYNLINLQKATPSYCRQFHNRSIQKPDKKAIVTPFKHIQNSRMVQNTLYSSRLVPNSSKSGMYSARNGLYTIQSQSDSSCSEARNDKFLNLNQDTQRKSAVGLENSLGYLP